MKKTQSTNQQNKKATPSSQNQKEAGLNVSAEKLKKQLEIIMNSKQNKPDRTSNINIHQKGTSEESIQDISLDGDENIENSGKGLFMRIRKNTNLWAEKNKSSILGRHSSFKSSNSVCEVPSGLSPISDSMEKISKTIKYQKVIQEIYETEFSYANDLESVVNGYMNEMDNPEWRDTSLLLFGNIREIFAFSRNLADNLKSFEEDTTKISELFSQNKDKFISLYGDYCTNYVLAIEKLEDLLRDQTSASFFSNIQAKLHHMLPISSYLLKPVQRILKYHLLLSSLADSLKKVGLENDKVKTASEVMSYVADEINRIKREKEDSARFAVFKTTITNLENFELDITGPILIEEIASVNRSPRLILVFKRYVLINCDLNGNIECTNVLPIRQIDIVFDPKRSKLSLKLDDEPFIIKGKTEKSTKTMYEKIKKLKQEILDRLKSKDASSSNEFTLPVLQIQDNISPQHNKSGNLSVFKNDFEDSSGSNAKDASEDSVSLGSFDSSSVKPSSSNSQISKAKQNLMSLRNSISTNKYGSFKENSSRSSKSNYSSLRKSNKKSNRPSITTPQLNVELSHSFDFSSGDNSQLHHSLGHSKSDSPLDRSCSPSRNSLENCLTDSDLVVFSDGETGRFYDEFPSAPDSGMIDAKKSSHLSRKLPLPPVPLKSPEERGLKEQGFIRSFSVRERRLQPPPIPSKSTASGLPSNRSSMFIPQPPPKNYHRLSVHGLISDNSQKSPDSLLNITRSVYSSKSEEMITPQLRSSSVVKKPVPKIPQKKTKL